ncbi:MAG TPA: hypothetical protein VEB19_02455 [Gemmatimonadaceae bacterium]|nr:hypothetical protein [Gemmatimonadaceae bacterium]
MHARLSALLVAAGAVAALSSCGDPTAIKARLTNFEAKHVVYSVNGSSPILPTGIRIRTAAPVYVGPEFAFDLAVDLTDTGTVKLMTARSLATEIQGSLNRVGLRDSPGLAFESIIDPPRDLFVYDSILVVPVGRTVLVDVFELSCQQEALLGFNIRAKLRVDSVDIPNRAVYIHMVTNPNCGFSQLVPGGQLPKE